VPIAQRNHIIFTAPRNATTVLVVLGGTVLVVIGLTLFSASVFYFWSRGRGTLAPWDPPRQFVVDGPYRFVRNPMYLSAGLAFGIIRHIREVVWALAGFGVYSAEHARCSLRYAKPMPLSSSLKRGS